MSDSNTISKPNVNVVDCVLFNEEETAEILNLYFMLQVYVFEFSLYIFCPYDEQHIATYMDLTRHTFPKYILYFPKCIKTVYPHILLSLWKVLEAWLVLALFPCHACLM